MLPTVKTDCKIIWNIYIICVVTVLFQEKPNPKLVCYGKVSRLCSLVRFSISR